MAGPGFIIYISLPLKGENGVGIFPLEVVEYHMSKVYDLFLNDAHVDFTISDESEA